MNTTIIDPKTFTSDKVVIPEAATQDEWAAIHRTILLCRTASRAWLRQSRAYAEARWGAEYVAEAEEQMELALGLPAPEPKPTLNPDDKSRAIVTIEGVAQQFTLWHRKMAPEIAKWDKERLMKAAELLKPQAELYRKIWERLSDKG